MNVELLDKIRRLKKLTDVDQLEAEKVGEEIVETLGKVLQSEIVLLVSEQSDTFSPEITNRLWDVLSTNENSHMSIYGFDSEEYTIVAPITFSHKRLGTILLHRPERYAIDDVVIVEFAEAILSELMGAQQKAADEKRVLDDQSIAAVLSALTGTEKKIAAIVLKEIDYDEGTIVLSKLAEREGIRHFAAVNAVRKLSSAGLVSCVSRGRNGVSIKVLNDRLQETLEPFARTEEKEEIFVDGEEGEE